MKFMAEKERIEAALEFVSRYADARSRIPILETVKFDAGERGVSITATNLDQGAITSFDAHTMAPGIGCLNGSLLLKAMRGTDAADVQIEAEDGEAKVQIGKRVQIKLPVLPPEDFPECGFLASDADSNFTINASLLARHAAEVAFAESKETRTRLYLCGTYWALRDDGMLDLVATDGVRLSLLSAAVSSWQIPSIIVPPLALPKWEGEVFVSASQNFVRFTRGRDIVATKLVDGSFPDYRRAIPDNPVKLLFDRKELNASLSRMALVGTSPIVMFVGREGKATISTASIQDSTAITDEIIYDGDDFQISFAHTVIASVIQSFGSEMIEWRYADHATPATFHDPKDDGRLAVAFPYRDARLIPYIATPEKEAA